MVADEERHDVELQCSIFTVVNASRHLSCVYFHVQQWNHFIYKRYFFIQFCWSHLALLSLCVKIQSQATQLFSKVSFTWQKIF